MLSDAAKAIARALPDLNDGVVLPTDATDLRALLVAVSGWTAGSEDDRVWIVADGYAPRALDSETECPENGWSLPFKASGIYAAVIELYVPDADLDEDVEPGWVWAFRWIEDWRRPTVDEMERVQWLA